MSEGTAIFATVCCVAIVASCRGEERANSTTNTTAKMAFLTREGCANTAIMREHLDAALRSLNLPVSYAVINLDTLPDTDARSGYPTPTVLLGNRDLFGMPEPPVPHPPAT